MTRKCKHVWRGVVVLVLVFFVAVPTNAQDASPEVKEKARALYKQAIDLMDKQEFVQACPKLEVVTVLIPSGVGARQILGECYEKSGRVAQAWEQYGLAEMYAMEAGRAKEAQDARAAAAKIRPHVVLVTLVVAPEMRYAVDVSVSWDGVRQEKPAWGTALPVEMGKHVVEAKRPMHESWRHEIEFDKGGTTHEIQVPVLKPAQPEQKRSPPVTPQSQQIQPQVRKVPPVRVVPAKKPERAWMAPTGVAAMGIGVGGMVVGVAGIVVGGVLGGQAMSNRDASYENGHCKSDGRCDSIGFALREEMTSFATGSTVGLAAGGILAGAGIGLLVIGWRAKKEDKARNTSALQMQVWPGGVALRGTW